MRSYAARRSAAREQLRGPPARDPLWAATHTAALSTNALAAAPTAPGNAEDAMAMGIDLGGAGQAA